MKNKFSILAFIFILGLGLRLMGLTYGLPTTTKTLTTFHPDEAIFLYSLEKMDPWKGNFHPGDAWFWGTFNLYSLGVLYKGMETIGLLQIKSRTFLLENLHQTDRLYIVGRLFSILFGLLALFVFWKCTSFHLDPPYRYLAVLFFSITPILVSSSFYNRPESTMLFWGLLTYFFIMKTTSSPSLKNYLLAGMCMGLSFCSKYTGVVFAFFIIARFIDEFWKEKFSLGLLKRYAVTLGTALVIFVILNFYMFIDFQAFCDLFSKTFGKAELPKNVFAGLTEYIFTNLSPGLGWPLFLTCVAGLLCVGFIDRSRANIYAFSFVCLYYLRFGSPLGQYSTYCLPIIPFLIIFSVHLLKLVQVRWIRVALILILFVYTTSYSFAHKSLLLGKDTREQASDWIKSNISTEAPICMIQNSSFTPPVLKKENSPYNRMIAGHYKDTFIVAYKQFFLMADSCEYVVFSDGDTRDYDKEDFFPKVFSKFSLEKEFVKTPPKFFGVPYYSDKVALDWHTVANPHISILKKKS